MIYLSHYGYLRSKAEEQYHENAIIHIYTSYTPSFCHPHKAPNFRYALPVELALPLLIDRCVHPRQGCFIYNIYIYGSCLWWRPQSWPSKSPTHKLTNTRSKNSGQRHCDLATQSYIYMRIGTTTTTTTTSQPKYYHNCVAQFEDARA